MQQSITRCISAALGGISRKRAGQGLFGRAHGFRNESSKSVRTTSENIHQESRRSYTQEYRTPAEVDLYQTNLPVSKWNYLYFLMPLTCFGLGYWQVERLEWKNKLIRDREEGLKAPPMPLNLEGDPLTLPRELAWKPVSVQGRWLHNLEVHMVPRVLNGHNGAHVITPLQTSDGHRVLVNRGFVPKDKLDPTKRPESLPSGQVTVVGTLREIVPKPAWVPTNEPQRGLWYWVDIPAVALHTHSDPFLLEQLLDTEYPHRLPIGGQLHQPLSNNHFQYAVTWVTLGFVLTAMSFYMIRRGSLPPTARPPYVVPPKHRPSAFKK